MRTLLKPLLVLALASVALSACEVSVTPDAATVNSKNISTSTLNSALSAIAGDKALQCDLAAQSAETNSGTSSVAIEGTGSGTFSSTFVASELTNYVRQIALSTGLAHLGITTNAAERSLAVLHLESGLDPISGTTCTASGATVLANLSSSYRNFLISLETDQDALATHQIGVADSTSGLTSYASAHPGTMDIACVSAIVVSSELLANTDIQNIKNGTPFATAAKNTSIDSTSAADGGAIGCVPPTDFEAPLSTAIASLAIGQVSSPLPLEGDYVLLEVTSRQSPSAVEVLNALVDSDATSENNFVASYEKVAKVRIDARYGSWEHAGGQWQVVPPTGPANADLANATAVTPQAIAAPTASAG